MTDEAGQSPPALGWGKPLALLCYLAVNHEVRRDEIVDLLWRDVDEAKARNAFRQALHRLRSALGDELIPHDRDRLRLGQSNRLNIDLAEFERLVELGQSEAAFALYNGDFLHDAELGEPAFDHWVEQERSRLRARFRHVVEDAVIRASREGRWAEAIARAKKLAALAPYDPEAAKLAASTLLSAGKGVDALQCLREFVARSESDLGITVAGEVHALLARLSREVETRIPSAPETGTSSPGTTSLPFIGREHELSQLLSLWQTVAEDAGAFALIEGDTGIGKTRLVRELASHARALGSVLVLPGRERSAGAQLPYGIFAEALRPLVRAPGVAGGSAHLLAEAARLLPELRDSYTLPEVSDVRDESARLRFFEGVAALVDAAAYEQRILVVLEDVQHIAPSSLDLLSYLAVRLAAAPVMFAVTLRPNNSSAVASRLRALTSSATSETPPHGARTLRLQLGPIETRAILEALRASDSAWLSTSTAEQIARQCEGNPLRLLQGLRYAAGQEDGPKVPIQLREVMQERLNRLSSTQRRVFLVLAILSRSIAVASLAPATHLTEASCREALRILEEQGLIEQSDAGVQVANDLASEVALDAAGGPGRAFLSGWIADALALERASDAGELARLYAVAGRASRAFEFARRAAFAALANGAVAEASQLFTLARTFASTSQAHAEIEGTLDALGEGRRRLPTGVVQDRPAKAFGSDAMAQEAEVRPVAIRAAWLEQLFPNWRVLFGAAVASLLLSAVVLRTRLGAPETVPSSRSLDTLVVSEASPAGGARRLAIGNLGRGFTLTAPFAGTRSNPAWVDSLPHAWSRAMPAPLGLHVALTHATSHGTDLVVVSANRRDSVVLLSGQSDATPLGWSPDGAWLLASQRMSGAAGSDSRLLALPRHRDAAPRTIDASQGHSVTEAQWSPDGARIAWVARVGEDKQLEVYTSSADGSDVRNVSRNVAEDYHIAWSPDGDLLCFTSTRDGNAELYAMDVAEDRLWRLTRNSAHTDHCVFSPDGRAVAFESTRGGTMGVYVMPALGGQSQLITRGGRVEIVGWGGQQSRFVSYVGITTRDIPVGGSEIVRARAFDFLGDSITPRNVEWTVLDSAVAQFSAAVDVTSSTRSLVGRRSGVARVVATVGHWRSDTAVVRVGDGPVSLLRDDVRGGLGQWHALGMPTPITSPGSVNGVVLRAPRDWEGGLLSRVTLPLSPGLIVDAAIAAPWTAPPEANTQTIVALVTPEDVAAMDSVAPALSGLASMRWKADAARMIYAVGREIFTEPIDTEAHASRRFRMRVEPDSTVTFFLDDRPRWRSTLRLGSDRGSTRAHLWLAGRATAGEVRVLSASAALTARHSLRPTD